LRILRLQDLTLFMFFTLSYWFIQTNLFVLEGIEVVVFKRERVEAFSKWKLTSGARDLTRISYEGPLVFIMRVSTEREQRKCLLVFCNKRNLHIFCSPLLCYLIKKFLCIRLDVITVGLLASNLLYMFLKHFQEVRFYGYAGCVIWWFIHQDVNACVMT